MSLPSGLVYPYPPYLGFTQAEMETELANNKAALKALSLSLSSASINGQSFQFADIQKQIDALNQRGAEIRLVMDFLVPGYFQGVTPGDTTLAVLK